MPDKSPHTSGCAGTAAFAAVLCLVGSRVLPTNESERWMYLAGFLISAAVAVAIFAYEFPSNRSERKKEADYRRAHPLGKQGCADAVKRLCQGRQGKGALEIADRLILHFDFEVEQDLYEIVYVDEVVFQANFERVRKEEDYDAEPRITLVPEDGGYVVNKDYPKRKRVVNDWYVKTYHTKGNWERILFSVASAR